MLFESKGLVAETLLKLTADWRDREAEDVEDELAGGVTNGNSGVRAPNGMGGSSDAMDELGMEDGSAPLDAFLNGSMATNRGY